jgi:glycine oxidase
VRCGGLELNAAAPSAGEQEWHGDGATVETVDEHTARRLEPALAAGLGPALHLPDLAQLRNPRHLQALVAGCGRVQARLRPRTPAQAMEKQGNRITALRSGEERIRAGRFVLAGGAWTDELLAPLGCRLGVHPVRGQIALLHTGQPLFRRVLMSGPRYLVPRLDGRVLVGSTEEDVGFDKRTTAAAIRDLLALALGLVPALADAPLERCWAGLRPGSPDGLPFLGPVPGVDNVFVAAGHFRAGIGLSAGTALLIKELLLGQALTLPLEPFSLARPVREAKSH